MTPHRAAVGRSSPIVSSNALCGLFVVRFLVLFLALIPATAAHAQDIDGGAVARLQAQELLDRGNELFRAGDLGEALRVYREAHEVFQSPKLFLNMALCEEALAQRQVAMQHFSAFLSQVPDADTDARAQAESSIANLRRQLVALNVAHVPPNSTVRVDDQPAALTPLEQPIWLEPGAHRVSVDRPGQPLWITSVEGLAGATVELTVPEPAPPLRDRPDQPPPAPDGARQIWRQWWFWTAIAVVVAAGTAVTIVKLRSCAQTVCE